MRAKGSDFGSLSSHGPLVLPRMASAQCFPTLVYKGGMWGVSCRIWGQRGTRRGTPPSSLAQPPLRLPAHQPWLPVTLHTQCPAAFPSRVPEWLCPSLPCDPACELPKSPDRHLLSAAPPQETPHPRPPAAPAAGRQRESQFSTLVGGCLLCPNNHELLGGKAAFNACLHPPKKTVKPAGN